MEGQRQISSRAHTQSAGMRRVIGLAVLLALVIICMVKMQDRSNYEPMFRAVGLLPDTKSSLNDQIGLEFGSDTISKRKLAGEKLFVQFPDLPIWYALLDQSSKEQLLQLTLALFGTKSSGDSTAISDDGVSREDEQSRQPTKLADWFAKIDSTILEWESAGESLPDIERTRLSNFKSQWQSLKQVLDSKGTEKSSSTVLADSSEPSQKSFLSSLQIAVDRKLLDNVVDSATWRSTESLTFARTLQRAKSVRASLELNATNIASMLTTLPTVDIPLLTRQMPSLRGSLVRIEGSVRRADARPITKLSRIGESSYHVLWLKPTFGSTVPFCVYLISENSEDANPLSVDEDQVIEFAALPLKRLAYASESGIQVAPVLVAIGYNKLTSNSSANTTTLANALATKIADDPLLSGVADKSNILSAWKSPTELVAQIQLLETLLLKPIESFSRSRGKSSFESKDGDDPSLENSLESPFLSRDELVAAAQICSGVGRLKNVLTAESFNATMSVNVKMMSRDCMVKAVQPIVLPSAIADGLNQKFLFRLTTQSLTPGTPDESVLVLSVPDSWEKIAGIGGDIFQPANIKALVLTSSGDTTIGFTDRVEWVFPSSLKQDVFAALQPPVSTTLGAIASNGWDLSRLDEVRNSQKKPLGPDEAEAFFRFINATADLPKSEPNSSITVVDCLRDPEKNFASEVEANIQSVKITRIKLNRLIDQVALGSDQYFEINALADIGNQSIRLVAKPGDDPLIFTGEFPVTLVSKDIPSELLPNEIVDRSNGDLESESWFQSAAIQFRGRFYRLWAFETTQTDAMPGRGRQVAPLIMCTSMKALKVDDAADSNWIINTTFTIICVLVLIAWATAKFIDHRSQLRKNARTPLRSPSV